MNLELPMPTRRNCTQMKYLQSHRALREACSNELIIRRLHRTIAYIISRAVRINDGKFLITEVNFDGGYTCESISFRMDSERVLMIGIAHLDHIVFDYQSLL